MTIDETYKYLKRVRVKENEIRYAELKRQELEACLYPRGINYNGDRVQTSATDKQAELSALVIDLERLIMQYKTEKAGLIIEITSAIENLTDDNEKLVLLGYYIGGKSMQDVSELISYSPRSAYNFHRSGVAHLAKMLS